LETEWIFSQTNKQKCKSLAQKEFKYCDKHISHWLDEFPDTSEVQHKLSVASELGETLSLLYTDLIYFICACVLKTNFLTVVQLEDEIQRAKTVDHDLFQRKSKLGPKYRHIVEIFEAYLHRVNENFTSNSTEIAPIQTLVHQQQIMPFPFGHPMRFPVTPQHLSQSPTRSPDNIFCPVLAPLAQLQLPQCYIQDFPQQIVQPLAFQYPCLNPQYQQDFQLQQYPPQVVPNVNWWQLYQ
jgi:hypothetical protein